MRDYKILTTLTNSEMLARQDKGDKLADFDLYNEQEQELVYNCFFNGFNTPIMALYEDKIYYYETIDKAIEELLSMKEGCDLVEFDNGFMGFVGYNGSEITSFEMRRKASELDLDFMDNFEFYPTIEEFNNKIEELCVNMIPIPND